MEPRFSKPLIPADRIEEIIQMEPALILIGLVIIAWLFYKIFLRNVSPARHRSLRRHFANLLIHSAIFSVILASYWGLHSRDALGPITARLVPYVGLIATCWGAMIFIKACRLNLLQYLFFMHMKAGVPIVLVNSFTLLLSAVVYGWVAKEVFSIQVGPLLATSAIFSILLGLALQETLGNLFAGIALQLDKPFDIGDWVEITGNNTKWVGQVHEISWRATVLIGLSEEWISIPNRVIGQGQVSNFSIQEKPIMRRYIFRLPYGSNLEKASEALVRACFSVPEICKYPEPKVLIDEGTESWIPLKLLFYIENYGDQWAILDQVYKQAVHNLSTAGIALATTRVELVGDSEQEKSA